MELVVDGVFLQLTYSGIARLWSSILPRLARYPSLDIVLLDRGNCPAFDGIERVECPSYTLNANTATDSLFIKSGAASSVPTCFHQHTIRTRRSAYRRCLLFMT